MGKGIGQWFELRIKDRNQDTVRNRILGQTSLEGIPRRYWIWEGRKEMTERGKLRFDFRMGKARELASTLAL